eukprot:Tamp_13205.p1 GENE.Tamp_13205~~Tamp_13205.p1  ORF type:complete len:291 (+),score=49.45 Tamp_13205:291-1163(+)
MGVRTQSPLKTRGPDRTRSAILDGYTGRVDQDSQLLIARDLNLKDGLLAQYARELETRGEHVTIMCVGESGVGKSSLISNIFTVALAKAGVLPTQEIIDKPLRIESDGIPLSVTFVDTPGYGDVLELGKTFKAIASDIDRRLLRAVEEEERGHRPDMGQRRRNLGVDAVLYFIAPHRLKGVDIEFMKVIQNRASIIPILAKADTMTAEELTAFRTLVTTKLAEAEVAIYRGPFAVISAPTYNEHGNSSAAGRSYPWGTAESENEAHSDIRALRKCLITDGVFELHQATEV